MKKKEKELQNEKENNKGGEDKTCDDKLVEIVPPEEDAYKFDSKMRKRYLNLIRNGGQRVASIESLGITKATLYYYIEKHPEFKQEMAEQERLACEPVVQVLRNRVLNGDLKAIEFWLTNRDPESWKKATAVEVSGNKDKPLHFTYSKKGENGSNPGATNSEEGKR